MLYLVEYIINLSSSFLNRDAKKRLDLSLKLGLVYTQLGDNSAATQWLCEALTLSKDTTDPSMEVEVWKHLVRVIESNGDASVEHNTLVSTCC